jgi:tRNA nucleotidyltransferase (CCA-adding enzyme)
MSDRDARTQAFALSTLPVEIPRVSRDLLGAGHTAFTVGPSLRDLIAGVRPPHFELSTDASLTELARVFPRAVLIDARQGKMTIPTPAGPIDVTPFQSGPRVEDDLAHRDFTINAMAYDANRDELLDPYGGRADLANGLLRAVGSARDRFEEDPLRALRAVRLAATRGWKLDSELESALASSRERLAGIPREPVRRELKTILLSPGVTLALDQLERSGITAQLAPNVIPRSGAVVERLSRDLELRLTGWLRGARPSRVLQQLRFSSGVIHRVASLMRLHPVSSRWNHANRNAMTRFVRKTGSRDLNALIELEEAEADMAGRRATASRDALLELREAMDRLRDSDDSASGRKRLAISGADVMKQLDCGPGPRIGRALAYLTERVAVDPTLNAIDELRELLLDWGDRDQDR